MAVTDILLTDILGAPPILPGAVAWDSNLNDQLVNVRGDMGMGVLCRRVSITPTSVSTGIILMTAPAGWSAMMTNLIVVRQGATTINTVWSVGSDTVGNPLNWHDGFNCSALNSDQQPLLVYPFPNAATVFTNTAPQDVPLINGNLSNNSYYIRLKSGPSLTAMIIAFGHAWRNT